MKKIWIVVMLALALAVSGCASTVTTGVGAGNLMTDINAGDVEPGNTVSDMTGFAVNFLQNTYDEKNTVVSPVSAYLALAMTANGAAGPTLREFEQVLGARLSDLDDTGKLLLDAFNEANGVTLQSANGIWYDTASGFEATQAFLQTNADYFGAAAVKADFSEKATLDAINRYVSDNTNGLIDKILDDIEADIMVLINTLYFKGDWAEQFDPTDTMDAAFTLSNGESIMTPMMEQTYDAVPYFDADSAKGILLPYLDDRYAYAAILPDGSASDFVSSLTPETFKSLLGSAADEKVKLFMPKYETEGDYNLNDALKAMGLALAFDPGSADFSEMGSAESGNIFIDKVKQKTVFKLGEEGTEAAAATSVEMNLEAMPIEDDLITLRLDRPFVYALMDMETMTPLFLGVLENPAA